MLVVDDNKDLRESLRDLLVLLGHTVLEASNGDEALQVMAIETVDVVVTDLYMPGLNGMELMREMTRRRHRPKVIAMTGVANLDSAGTASAVTKLGASALLFKPFSIERLTDTFADL